MTLYEFKTRNALRPTVALASGWIQRVQRSTKGTTTITVAGHRVNVAETYEAVVFKLSGKVAATTATKES